MTTPGGNVMLGRAMFGAGIAAIAGLLTACPRDAFTCESDVQCGTQGSCELDGFCSFPDTDCESGQRYGSAGSSRECVPVGKGETGTPATGSEDAGTATLTTSGPTSTDSTTSSTSAESTVGVSSEASASMSRTSGDPPGSGSGSGSSTTDPPPGDPLLLHFSCESEDGSPFDASSYEHPVSCDGCPTPGEGPNGTTGCEFNGSGVAFVESSDVFITESFSVMGWVLLTDPMDGGCETVATKVLPDAGKASWALAVCTQDGVSQVVGVVCPPGIECSGGTVPLADAGPLTWVHLAFTHSAERGALYLDGGLATEFAGGDVEHENAPILVGAMLDPDTPDGVGQYLRGGLADLRVYDTQLSAGEIDAIMSGDG